MEEIVLNGKVSLEFAPETPRQNFQTSLKRPLGREISRKSKSRS